PAGGVLRDELATAFEVPVAVNNDANLAALAEHQLGAAKGHESAAVITLGSNIGLGVIVGGEIVRGAHGSAGEAGLILLTATSTDAETNGCGPGGAERGGCPSSSAAG